MAVATTAAAGKRGDIALKVHIYPKIERQLTALEARANAPAFAAERARQIIATLIRDGNLTNSGLLRRRSDRRVKNCLKFNLGSGFRLVCIKEKNHLFVMFVGHHDACDTWLDTYRKKRPHKTDRSMIAFPVDTDPGGHTEKKIRPVTDVSLTEEPRFPEISQKDLRRVFNGLVS